MPLDAESMMKIIWLVLLVTFAGAEAVTVGLTSIWFAAGAAVRPLARRHLNDRVEPTNADRVIGAEAQVTENIDNIHGKGAVVIRGMTWSARSEDGGPIAVGTMVRVLRIEGVKVFVTPIAAPVSAGEPKTW